MDRAVAAARTAFDRGPWSHTGPRERAVYLNKIADACESRTVALADAWSAEAGVLRSIAGSAANSLKATFRYCAGLAETFQ